MNPDHKLSLPEDIMEVNRKHVQNKSTNYTYSYQRKEHNAMP